MARSPALLPHVREESGLAPVSSAPRVPGRRPQGAARKRTSGGLSAGSYSLAGGFWYHNQTIMGEKGRSGTLPGLQALGGASPVLSGLSDVRVSMWRKARAGACWPPPLAPADPAPQLQLGFRRRSLPARCPSAAQPNPDRIRLRTLAAVAKDRRTPHYRLKIRPPSGAATQDIGRALPGPRGRVGLRRRVEGGPGSSGSGCTVPCRRRGYGRGQQDRGTGREHRGARGFWERTCVEVRGGAWAQYGTGRHRDGPLWGCPRSCRQAAESRRELTLKRLSS